jgi:peptidoglycan-associated lipoprotein
VSSTITFAFNSAVITPEAATILARQASWIAQFPEVRFRVYGHTDLVGSDAYNKSLGLHRAQAVVSFFASRGISRSRLEAVTSFGETQPVVASQGPEQANRRTVTEVTGFVKGSPSLVNGKYIEVVWREYVDSATRPHPDNNSSEVQLSGGAGG